MLLGAKQQAADGGAAPGTLHTAWRRSLKQSWRALAKAARLSRDTKWAENEAFGPKHSRHTKSHRGFCVLGIA
jgi:hypothetical protein